MTCLIKQKGVVLITALIFLILLSLIGVVSMGTGILELRMASNEEDRMLTFQTAQAIVDQIAESRSNFVVSGVSGNIVICTDTPENDCANETLTLNGSIFSNGSKASIRRLAPSCSPPPRLRQGSTADQLQASYFQIEAEHDASSFGQGKAEITQGYLLLIPAGPGC